MYNTKKEGRTLHHSALVLNMREMFLSPKKFKQKLMVFEIIAWKFDITLMNSNDNYINLRLLMFFSSFFEMRDKLI